MARLTSKARNALPDSAFLGPGRTYPGEDKGHARSALSRASANAGSALKARIRAKVKKKFPDIHVEGAKTKHRMDRPRRHK